MTSFTVEFSYDFRSDVLKPITTMPHKLLELKTMDDYGDVEPIFDEDLSSAFLVEYNKVFSKIHQEMFNYLQGLTWTEGVQVQQKFSEDFVLAFSSDNLYLRMRGYFFATLTLRPVPAKKACYYSLEANTEYRRPRALALDEDDVEYAVQALMLNMSTRMAEKITNSVNAYRGVYGRTDQDSRLMINYLTP